MYPSALPSTHTYIYLLLNVPLAAMLLNHLYTQSNRQKGGFPQDLCENPYANQWFCEMSKLEIKPNQTSGIKNLLGICAVVVTMVVIFGRGIIGIIW